MIDQHLIIKSFKEFLTTQGASLRTQKGYVFDLQYFLNWLNKRGILVEDISHKEIKSYIKLLEDQQKSIATINRHLSTLRVFSQFLIEQNIIHFNPMQGIQNLSFDDEIKPFLPILSAYEMEIKQQHAFSGQAAHQKTVITDFLRWVSKKTPA